MPDICIFYSDPDGQKVDSLSLIFEELGWSVWSGRCIRCGKWGRESEEQIKRARLVIVIWNSHAIRGRSITYVEAELSRKYQLPMITLISSNVVPPLPFNAEHITEDISDWRGASNAKCILTIIEGAESILGNAPASWNGERPSFLNLRGRQVKVPCFVKSLSSHETQLDPEQGLIALSLFPEVDAVLISAYDMYLPKRSSKRSQKIYQSMINQIQKLDERGAFILLDSGNYEKSRKNDASWSKRKFYSVLKEVPFTYAFCFDNLRPKADPAENALDVISRIEGDHEDKLIPILHAPKDKNGEPKFELLPDIFYEYASRRASPFIAVPERELGDGMRVKVDTVLKIRRRLADLNRYQPIHILGTGNPLSILILSAAGADLFDGLEWCRTVADKKTGFLFHHQQFDFFKHQTLDNPRYGLVKEILEHDEASLKLKMGVHNLQFFAEWMEELQATIKAEAVGEMLLERSVFDTRDLVVQLKDVMPGLFS